MKGDKDMLRKDLMGGICEAAEGIMDFYSCQGNGKDKAPILFVDRYCPLAFKPGLADKLLFMKIIDKCIDNVFSEIRNNPSARINNRIVGIHLMRLFYWSYYGWCDERELEENRRAKNE